MRLKEKNLLKKFAATLKKFSAQGAKKVEYGTCICCTNIMIQTDRMVRKIYSLTCK